MNLIKRYYEEMWNQWNIDLADELLAIDFTFRGSLGREIKGREEFKGYMRSVKNAFSDFHNKIEELISSPTHEVARLTYSGTQDGTLFGIPPAFRHVSYPGIAIFRIDRGLFIEGYVVADRLTLVLDVLGAELWTAVKARPHFATELDGVTVRSAGVNDFRWCAELMAGSEPWITLGRDIATASSQLYDPGKELYVAFREENAVGFVLIDMRGPFGGYIQSICVTPNARNRGTGAALLQLAEERILREQPNVFLCVSSFNLGAKRFYARHKYEQVGELPNFIIPDASEILLRKSLGPKRWFELGNRKSES